MDDENATVVQIVLVPDQPAASPVLSAIAERYGASLSRQFDNTDDPALTPFWVATVPAAATEQFILSLRALPEVDGAYVKPGDSPA